MLKRQPVHVVILGGGFAGLTAARALDAPDVRITLIDRSNHHLFQPLLYQVATAALAAPDVSAPIRQILSKQQNVTVLMASIQKIEVERKRVLIDGRHLEYDYLLLATGTTSAYFGRDRWSEFAPGLKTIGDALDIRRRILRAFEAAEMEPSEEVRRAWTTFVVIGGGPTGVEMAGALAEIAGRTLARDFRRFDPRTTRVILIESSPRVLSTFPEELSAKAHRELERLGIEVRTNVRATDLGPDFVEVGDDVIQTRTVLWAAGVKASPLTAHLGVPLDRAGRIWVEDDLSVPDRPEVFALGDLIAKTQDGKPLPGVAQLAVQSGRHAAKCILASVRGHVRRPFHYVDKGSMATIGRHKAVAQLGRFKFGGVFAWWTWLLVHVLALVGFRSRLSVLLEWAFSYFTWQRRSRVILEVPSEKHELAAPSMLGAVLRIDPATVRGNEPPGGGKNGQVAHGSGPAHGPPPIPVRAAAQH
jgi:NADH dehydrogenase